MRNCWNHLAAQVTANTSFSIWEHQISVGERTFNTKMTVRISLHECFCNKIAPKSKDEASADRIES